MQKAKKKRDYDTVGVRFIIPMTVLSNGNSISKIYTYKVRKGAKVHLGQELIADSPIGAAIVAVVRIDKVPQDIDPMVSYKFIDRKATPL